MKQFFTIAALATALAAALLVCGCDNPAGGNTAENTGNNPAGAEPRIEAVEGFFAEEAVPGALAATFTFPEYGGPWAAALVSGENSAHNGKFVVSENTLRIGGAALAAGTYKVRVRVTGGAYRQETALVFPVTNTPVAFAKPPSVTPFIGGAPNQNTLVVSWPRRAGATGCRVYISTTNSTAGLTPAKTVSGGDATSADNIPGYNSLPDGAWYYVWVKAFNADGETDFSPVKKQKTTDPIEAFWYTGDLEDFDDYYPAKADAAGIGWDSVYDNYIIEPQPDGSGVRLKYGGGTSGSAYDMDSPILYHRRFDPVEAEQASRLGQAMDGSLTTAPIGKMFTASAEHVYRLPAGHPPLAGSLPVSALPDEARQRFAGSGYPADGILPPSGVFIVRLHDKYYATFYHGMAALHPNPSVPANILVVFGNAAYGYCIRKEKPDVDFSRIAMYSPTFEHAVENYPDVQYYNYQIAFVAVPWLRREMQWVGSKTNLGGDSDAGWIPYPGDFAASFAGTSFPALASWLESQAENTSAAPYYAAVSGVNLRGLAATSNTDPWGWFFDKLKARFVSLDIDACTGATVGWVNNQMGSGDGNTDRQKIVSVRLPSAATRVSRFLFNGCVNLKSVVFPGGLQTIGGRAFKNCAALTSVNIPAGVQRIDQEAFLGCAGLTAVTIRAINPPIAKDDTNVTSSATGTMAAYSVFSGCDSAVFYVPAGRESAYAAALGGSRKPRPGHRRLGQGRGRPPANQRKSRMRDFLPQRFGAHAPQNAPAKSLQPAALRIPPRGHFCLSNVFGAAKPRSTFDKAKMLGGAGAPP